MLWTWSDLLAATNGRALGGTPPSGIEGICIDTRQLRSGDLFVALAGDPGPRFQASSRSDRDGHDYLDSAMKAGAAAVLVSREGDLPALPGIQVADTLDGLWSLGRWRRRQLAVPVVAVTGSSGKTTAKSFLAAALQAWSEPGSLNNHIGVPLSVARTPAEVPAAVYEVGTNHPGEILPLAQLVAPDVSVVLNVHPAHIGNFQDISALRAEKLSIARALRPGGTFVCEASLEASAPSGCRLLTFGDSSGADVRLVDVSGDTARYDLGGRSFSAHVPAGGRHRAMTLAAVIGVCMALELPLDRAQALPDELIPAGRGRWHDAGGIIVVDDSYNANPGSMNASLCSFVDSFTGRGRRLALLGEMLELGEDAESLHLTMAPNLQPLDGFWAVGEGMRVLRHLPNCLGWQAAADERLLSDVTAHLRAEDALLVKGSNRVFWGSRFAERLVDTLRSR
ncbi:MAG: UDP-N-acetylmuramoyl-tripeptide--D-alanyl-D-alanine ligase [Pseudomonadales bacterium]